MHLRISFAWLMFMQFGHLGDLSEGKEKALVACALRIWLMRVMALKHDK